MAYPNRAAEDVSPPEPTPSSVDVTDQAKSCKLGKAPVEKTSDSAATELIHETTRLILANKYGYKIGEKLGKGAFGQVFRAANDSLGKPECAVKVVDTTKMDEDMKKIFLPRELSVLIEVKHRFIVHVFDIFRHRDSVFIFMELAPNGDLGAYMRKHGQISESLVIAWFGQVCAAVAYLHNELLLAHRDIKLVNILLDKSCNTKLSDLGFAFVGDKSNFDEQRSQEYCGTLTYESPQIIEQQPYLPFKADIWALGVTLFALLANHVPFPCNTEDNQNILSAQKDYPSYIRSCFPERTSQPARHLVELMLNPDEQSRPAIVEVLSHKFLSPPDELAEEDLPNLSNFY